MPGIEKMSVFDIFGMMDDTQRAAIVDKITEQMDKMPDSILDQAAISYVKSTYEQIGLDTGHMSTVYILKTGAKMLGLAALGMAASILAVLWHQELELRSDVDSDVIPSAKSLDFLTQSLTNSRPHH